MLLQVDEDGQIAIKDRGDATELLGHSGKVVNIDLALDGKGGTGLGDLIAMVEVLDRLLQADGNQQADTDGADVDEEVLPRMGGMGQPIGAIILYPMFAVSGLFVPIASLPPLLQAVARILPLTYAVPLLQGIWNGDRWSAHVGDVAALAVVFVVYTALSAKVFRWE
jgi:hypothetical protein